MTFGIAEKLKGCLAAAGYDWKGILREGLTDEAIGILCKDTGYTVDKNLYPLYNGIDGERWIDRSSELLLIPFHTILSLKQAIEISIVVSGFLSDSGDVPPPNRTPFCFVSAESFNDHFYIDLNNYREGGSGLVFGFGPSLLTEDFKDPVMFDDIGSCFDIVCDAIQAGVSPCEYPGTVDQLKKFAEIAILKTNYKNNFWKVILAANS
jgi:hypothetical protein